jgi:hypothetical protein
VDHPQSAKKQNLPKKKLKGPLGEKGKEENFFLIVRFSFAWILAGWPFSLPQTPLLDDS